MQLKYRFFFGGDRNPFEKTRAEAYARLTEERAIQDPEKTKPTDEVFPELDSWADYLIENSKSVFWQMERDICKNADSKADEIAELWKDAKSRGLIGSFLERSEADEASKAMCYYMAALHRQFSPNDITVDFRYYIAAGNVVSPKETMPQFDPIPYME